MAKKKFIIAESAVRRFQKLATIKPLREGDYYMEDYGERREKPGEDIRKGAEKRGAEGTLAKTPGHGRVDYVSEQEEEIEDVEVVDDFAAPEEEVEAEVDAIEGGGAEEMARTVIQAVADALGVDIDIEGAGEEVEDVEMDIEEPPPEVDVGVDVEEEEPIVQEGSAGNMGRSDVANKASGRWLKEEEELDEDAETLEEEVIDEDALTEAVMRRVMARLKKMTTKKKKA